ncbi:hypothetical protein GCM10027172_03840 [Halomonas garicola]
MLVDGDEVVTDSYAIMSYLDRRYPEAPLLGEGMAETPGALSMSRRASDVESA